MNSLFRNLLFAGVAVLVLALDQFTKSWVTTLPRMQEIGVLPPVLYLLHTTNDGVAWSLFRQHTAVLAVLAIVFCAAILVLGRSAIQRSTPMAVALGLLFAGAFGNFLDRVRFGYVVDFIDVHIGTWYQWPTFNVADSAITVGMVMVVIYYWFFENRKEPGLEE